MTKDIKEISPRRILACQLRQIGDVVLLTPSLTLLKKKWPKAKIHVLTESKCAPVLENNPCVDFIWKLDKKKLSNPLRALAFYHRIARNKYDLLIDFQQLPRIKFVVAMARKSVRLTFEPPWYNRWLYTHWTKQIDRYAGQCKASILAPLGIEWKGESPVVFLTDQENSEAVRFLQKHGARAENILISVDPSHHSPTRKWPPAFFGRLAALAVKSRSNLKFLFLFGPGEKQDALEAAQALNSPEHTIVPEDVLSLRHMAALMGQASLHMGNCSAPSHFATALGIPTLIVRGSTDKDWSYPSKEHVHVAMNLPCQPCESDTCARGDLACLRQLSPETVLPSLLELLEKHSATNRL